MREIDVKNFNRYIKRLHEFDSIFKKKAEIHVTIDLFVLISFLKIDILKKTKKIFKNCI